MIRSQPPLAKPLNYSDLPEGVCPGAANYQAGHALYTYLSRPFVDDLAAFLTGRRVVEAYAGRGHLSALLREKSVDIRPTSLRRAHDGSDVLGHVIEVEELSVKAAVIEYRQWMDVLLVCWPTADEHLCQALPYLPAGGLIVFVGEVTDHGRQPPFLGGCASDAFFEAVEEVPEYRSAIRYPSLRCDVLKVYRVRKAKS